MIANRGEIAVRIIKTAKLCGLQTIAVYTLPDINALHTKLADKAICIGSGKLADSYLSIEKIINAASEAKAEAIHPGYGFLSENAVFARSCRENNIIFIGPNSKTIEMMGNKAEAKKLVSELGISCIPGATLHHENIQTALEIALRIGFPLMIKAALGGGGKGMRLVNKAEGFSTALKLAKSESLNAFGSDQIILERAIPSPRHIEIQIFGDHHGNIVHLGERDCSIQRRHQKIIEEAPSPAINEPLRAKLGKAAVSIAKKISYEGAGTVEFLLDKNKNFYFLEMNTRLQVEHPVTESIFDLDLVYLQFLVADQQDLSFQKIKPQHKGHAIEVRLYAESPEKEFLPCTGKLYVWDINDGEGIRIDTGVTKGSKVTHFYDPLLAKIIGYGNTRSEALAKLISSLENSSIFGVTNNRNFLIKILKQAEFRKGLATTSFFEGHYGKGYKEDRITKDELALIAALIFQSKMLASQIKAPNVPNELLGWSNTGYLVSQLRLKYREEITNILIKQKNQSNFSIVIDNVQSEVTLKTDYCLVNGKRNHPVSFNTMDRTYQLITPNSSFILEEIEALNDVAHTDKIGMIKAPMPGIISAINVRFGDKIKMGQPLIILEAMKMQHELLASMDGSIKEIRVNVGDQVSADDFLIEIESK